MATRSQSASRPGRLVLRSSPSRGAADGAWWPPSRSLTREIAGLFALWPATAGRIARILYSPPDWDDHPRSVPVPNGRVKTGCFPLDDTHKLVLTMLGGSRLTIDVIPPETSSEVATGVLRAVNAESAGRGNAREHAGTTRAREADAGSLRPAASPRKDERTLRPGASARQLGASGNGSSASSSSASATRRLRLRLSDTSELDHVDGVWWPWSRDLSIEATALVDGFPDESGRVTRILFSPPDWDDMELREPAARTISNGHVAISSFPSDDTRLMILTLASGQRLKLAVIPSDISAAEGAERLRAMGEAGPGEETLLDYARWDDESPGG